MNEPFPTLLRELDQLLPPNKEAGQALQLICRMLRERVPHYDWVGYYFAVPRERRLVLGPYEGEPTEHTKIPYGTGICGQSAETEDTFVVQDVSKTENYLSCSVHTKSEIVVPVMLDEAFVGEIDIDSHEVGPFTDDDRRFLSAVAEKSAPHIPEVFPVVMER